MFRLVKIFLVLTITVAFRLVVAQPAGFIENKGQIINQENQPNASVKYLLQGAGLNVQLRDNGFSYDCFSVGSQQSAVGSRQSADIGLRPQPEVGSRQSADIGLRPQPEVGSRQALAGRKNSVSGIINSGQPGSIDLSFSPNLLVFNRIDFDFVGMNPGCKVSAGDPLPGRINYYTTGTPVEGVMGVRSFRQVKYENLYPGIDAVFLSSGGENKFKYNFILKPGADLSFIKIKISGPDITLQEDGSLLLKTSTGSIEEIIPESYSEKDGIKTAVKCRFQQLGNGLYGIAAESPVPADVNLLIDPMPQRIWGTYFGGEGYETLMNGTLDGTGNLYFGGGTNLSTNLATAGAFQTTLQGISNGFVAKFNSEGFRIWSTYFGGTLTDNFRGITITNDNLYLYVAGEATSTGLATPGAFQTTPGSALVQDALLVKFDTSGARIWSTYYGGTAADIGYCCDADAAGGVYLLGMTKSPNVIATPGTYQTTWAGEYDAFLTRFNASGNRLWGTYYGGECTEMPAETGCLSDGNYVYIAGSTCSTTQISSPGVFQPNLSGTGTADGFLAKITDMGTREWGTYYGGTNDDAIRTVINEGGYIYFSGVTQSSGMSSPGAFQPSLNGISDGFITKFNSNCQRIWSTYFGGPEDEIARIFKGAPGELYLTGTTGSSIGIATPDAYQQIYGGNGDGMLIKFDTSGNPAWGTYYGGDQWENLFSGAYYDAHHIYCFGATNSLTSIASPGAFQVSHGGGGSDLLMVRFDACPYPSAPTAITGQNNVCKPATGVSYSVPPVTGATGYHWSLPTGVTITSGSGTNNISVDFSGSATSGTIWVYAINNCGNSDSISLPVTVTEGLALGITVTASANNICAGVPVTFTADTTNAGANPVFQWQVNGSNTGSGTAIFTYTPANNDAVTCTVSVPNATCLSNNPVTSLPVTMTVNPLLPVSVTVSHSPDPVCEGNQVTCTAVPSSGGTNPVFQWLLNGNPAGTNQPTYTYTPVNGDIITCTLTSSESCTLSNPVSSIPQQVTVTPNVPVLVSISTATNPVCGNIPVTFTGVQSVPGNLTWQWFVNGVSQGTNSSGFTYNPVNNDIVSCTLLTDLTCTTNNPATSNSITMHILETPQVILTHCLDSVTTTNGKPFVLKGAVPLGGTFSGPGVSGGIFNPALAGTGLKTITYTYTNSGGCSDSKIKVIRVLAPPAFTCGNAYRDVRDNNIYSTILIGTQCWFSTNLHYGNAIFQSQHQRDNCIPEIYQSSVGSPQSAVYQWEEMMNYTDAPGGQGLCPPGWHVPAEAEWNTLFSNYTNNAFAGAALKYSGFSGFNAVMTGIVPQNTFLQFYNFATFYWTSTSNGPYKAWAHGMNEPDPSVSVYPSARQNAFGVRCVKD